MMYNAHAAPSNATPPPHTPLGLETLSCMAFSLFNSAHRDRHRSTYTADCNPSFTACFRCPLSSSEPEQLQGTREQVEATPTVMHGSLPTRCLPGRLEFRPVYTRRPPTRPCPHAHTRTHAHARTHTRTHAHTHTRGAAQGCNDLCALIRIRIRPLTPEFADVKSIWLLWAQAVDGPCPARELWLNDSYSKGEGEEGCAMSTPAISVTIRAMRSGKKAILQRAAIVLVSGRRAGGREERTGS